MDKIFKKLKHIYSLTYCVIASHILTIAYILLFIFIINSMTKLELRIEELEKNNKKDEIEYHDWSSDYIQLHHIS